MSVQSLKRSRLTCEPVAPPPSSSSSSQPSSVPQQSARTPSSSTSSSSINRLPRALQSYVLAFLDQVGFAVATRISREWQVLAALPTSVPAALWCRPQLQSDWRFSVWGRLPSGLGNLLRQSAAAPATGFGGLRSLAITRLGVLDGAETANLAGAIRTLPSLVALELGGSMSLDNLAHTIVAGPANDASTRPVVLPHLRVLVLGTHLWTARLADIARAFSSLTDLTLSPGYLSRKMPPVPSASTDSFAALGARRQWQNWSALSLFAHLRRLTLSSRNVSWHVDVPDWQTEPDGVVVANEEEEMMCEADSAAAVASLRDRSGDRRPRLVPAFSGVAELVLIDWNGASARPIVDLARHLPRLARLVLRQCNFGSPSRPGTERRDLVANLAELVVERTHDCEIAGGVDFALRHTDAASVQVHSLLPSVATLSAACGKYTEPPYAAVCTELTSQHLHGDPDDVDSAAADALLVAASRRPLLVDYHRDPDVCRCEFAAPPNVSFARHRTERRVT